MIGTCGCRASNRRHDAPRRLDHPGLELPRRQAAGPAVEDLQDIGAGLDLPRQVLDRGLDQQVDQPAEARAVAIGPQPRLAPDRASPAPPPCRSPPSTARRKSRSAPSHAAGPAAAARPSRRRGRTWAESRSAFKRARSRVACGSASSRGPSPSTKSTPLAQRIRHHQDVGEQDRRVEAEAPDRLQRHLGGQRRRVAQLEEAAGLARAPRGTPAGSARPAASARSAAAPAPRRRRSAAAARADAFWRQRHR